MEIIVGKTAGFCYGVKNAVDKTKETVQKQNETYCLGELVHNKQVTQDLERHGLVIINNIENAKKNVIIRSHGVPKEVCEKAKELKLEVIDLTCPNVLKIHNIVKEYSSKGYYIFIIGQKDHAETIGTVSHCKQNSTIIESEKDINQAIKYSHNIVVMKNGQIIGEGHPKDVINEKTIKTVYNVEGVICNVSQEEMYFVPTKAC